MQFFQPPFRSKNRLGLSRQKFPRRSKPDRHYVVKRFDAGRQHARTVKAMLVDLMFFTRLFRAFKFGGFSSSVVSRDLITSVGKLNSVPKYVLRGLIRCLDNTGVLVPQKGPRI